MQKTAPKNTKSSRNETTLRISRNTKAIAHAKSLSKRLKFQKNMSKSILQIIQSCAVQTTSPKSTKSSRNICVDRFIIIAQLLGEFPPFVFWSHLGPIQHACARPIAPCNIICRFAHHTCLVTAPTLTKWSSADRAWLMHGTP